jgi:hypothetical protein
MGCPAPAGDSSDIGEESIALRVTGVALSTAWFP